MTERRSKDEVLSKKRADLRANALLQPAREERERAAARTTRLLVLVFPQLSAFEPSKRWSAIAVARRHAHSRRHVLVAQLAVLAPGLAWVAAVAAGWDRPSWLLWVASLTVVVGQLAVHLQTRAELRAMASARTRDSR
jgi:hypothetical protein